MRGFLQRGGLFLAVIMIIAGLLVGVTASVKSGDLQQKFEEMLQAHYAAGGTSENWDQELINAKIIRDRDQAAIYTGFILAAAGVGVMIFVMRHRSVHEMAADLEDEDGGSA